MEISKNKISLAMTNQSSSIPKSFSSDFHQRLSKKANCEETDENDRHLSSGRLQNSRKAAKNFMSPTIAAASKATAPRKKILVERNEASGSTYIEKNPKISMEFTSRDLGSGLFDGSSCMTPLSSKVSESGDSPDSLSSLPYDPVTNYLSPRPQFLRYKPNRRLEMVLRRESELRRGEERLGVDGCCSVKSRKSIQEDMPLNASISSPDESEKQEDGSNLCTDKLDLEPSSNPEIKESDDDEDVDEEEEEQSPGLCKQVLRSVLLLLVLICASSYISSTDQSTIPHSLQALLGFREGYLKIQDPVYQIIEDLKMGPENFSEVIGVFSGTFSILGGDVFSPYPQLGERGLSEPSVLENVDEEINGKSLFVDDLMERSDSEENESHETAGVMMTEEVGMAMETDYLLSDDVNSFERVPVARENKETGLSSNFIKQEEAKEQRVTEETGTVVDEWIRKEEKAENGMVKIEDISEEAQYESKSFALQNIESELNSSKWEFSWIESMQDKLFSKVSIVLSLILALVASMILGFLHLKHRKASVKDSSPTFQQPSVEKRISCFLESEPIIEKEKTHSAFLNKELIVEKGDSCVIPSSAHSIDNYDKFSSTRPPVVELLGEYRVGEINHSEKSFVQKSKKTGTEEIDFSLSQEMKMSSKSNKRLSFNSDAYPSVSDFSSAESSSFGSFTSMEKLKKKEEGSDGKVVVMTPVRRSSRIHNRVISP
ncbi:uncharacterized protein LOC131258290 [Magnolia sinica]|uniref:uncharacterized protein LOC131258290 n=1 Tax=Magnolia sinica TaxID=86752 RepID=UPI00265B3538|nr:uncharacterized protein LOC131258290 [Magnolia sinica]